MNFDFSEEQKQLRATVRRYLDENCSSKAVRATLEGANKYDARLWKGLADLGLLGVAIPEAYGGTGAGAAGRWRRFPIPPAFILQPRC